MNYSPHPDRYQRMKYRRTGLSGLLLPEVSLGLWHNFGGIDSFEDARAIIHHAFDQGITHFDLANNYGPPPGSSEETFGRILRKDFPGFLRDELVISTKAGYKMWEGPYGEWGSRKYMLASLDQSLKRMGLDYVDIFYSHRPDPGTPLEETLSALITAVHQGKALYIGLSNYSPEETMAAIRILKEHRIPCLIHQPRYSMFDRWVEDGLLKVLEEEGIGCIPYSPLAQGLLTDKYLNGIPTNSRIAKESGFLQEKDLTPDKINKVQKLHQLATQRGQSLAQMALSWILNKKSITSVLVGVSSKQQLSNNLQILGQTALSSTELKAIDEILIH